MRQTWHIGMGLILAALALPALAEDGALLRKQRFLGSAHVGNVQLALTGVRCCRCARLESTCLGHCTAPRMAPAPAHRHHRPGRWG